ncbi:MAG TPA: amino acid ABC transporter ATP-binding protein [Gammaproteobacteria bacterium]|nr:amino acid ABC transporter ATP-binding protein [Gammaproteobacteria bacterium]
MTAQTILELRNIRKAFGNRPILKDVSLQIAKGEVKSMIGPSGSGKSTLLRCANLLEHPDSGDILLEGESIKTGNINRHRAKIGFVFQDFNLFLHLKAVDNVALCLRKVKGMTKAEAFRRAHQELERIGLSEVAGNYPAQLSGGQQQRVAIARALAMDPTIVLFDEPTSALDPELTSGVLEAIRSLAQQGITMLIVSHEMEFVRSISDEVYFMRGGVVEWSGPPEEMDDNIDYLSVIDAGA